MNKYRRIDMQVLFLCWAGSKLVQVDVFSTIPGKHTTDTARAIMRKLWSAGKYPVDVCRIYPIKGTQIILGGEVYHEN
jgi:hypothetical protein